MSNIITAVMKTVCLILVLSNFVHAGFLESFCAQKCNVGLGGNLCRCNGFHFAGKRTMGDNLVDSENIKKIYDHYNLDRKVPAGSTVDTVETPYYDSNKDDTESNRLKEIRLAQTFLRWLMDSIDRHQERTSDGLFGYKGESPME